MIFILVCIGIVAYIGGVIITGAFCLNQDRRDHGRRLLGLDSYGDFNIGDMIFISLWPVTAPAFLIVCLFGKVGSLIKYTMIKLAEKMRSDT